MGSGASSRRGNDTKVTQKAEAKQLDKELSVINLDEFPAGKLNIYYGSQTGTAARFARTLAKEGKERGFKAKAIDLEDFKPVDLAMCPLAIFLMANYGEGEPTDNAIDFDKWMTNPNKSVRDTYLSNVSFTVFGLGNRQYEFFNRMGKKTNAALEALGAKRVYDYGQGDDGNGTMEEDFAAWQSQLWPTLISKFHKGGNDTQEDGKEEPGTPVISTSATKRLSATVVPPMPYQHPVTVNYQLKILPPSSKSAKVVPIPAPADKVEKKKFDRRMSMSVASTNRHFFTAPWVNVVANRELRLKGGEGSTRSSTRHIELDLTGTNITYETADNIAVLPENDPIAVEQLALALGCPLDQVYSVEALDPTSQGGALIDDSNRGTTGVPQPVKLDFPSPCTTKDLLSYYFDIHGKIAHSMLSQLVYYVTDPQQKSWLISILSEENNRAAFKAFVAPSPNGVYKSIGGMLSAGGELSSCKIPLVDLLHILPFLQPRYYTISSSSSRHPHTVHITVGITDRGVCSSFLQRLQPLSSSLSSSSSSADVDDLDCCGTSFSCCRVFVRASTFRLPPQITTPIILIGPGTGFAPMRALLQERQCQREKASDPGIIPGNNTLYFGCQKSTIDYIYRDEIEAMAANKVITSLQLAFSRDQEEKIYVQHLIGYPDNAQSLLNDLHAGGYVYICGGTRMGMDVFEAIVTVLMGQPSAMTKEQAIEFIKDLKAKGRYVQELWS